VKKRGGLKRRLLEKKGSRKVRLGTSMYEIGGTNLELRKQNQNAH